MSSVLGGCAEGGPPLISQVIVLVSLMIHVNIAGDSRHVVTLVGLVVKTADPGEDIRGHGDRHVLTSNLPRWLRESRHTTVVYNCISLEWQNHKFNIYTIKKVCVLCKQY